MSPRPCSRPSCGSIRRASLVLPNPRALCPLGSYSTHLTTRPSVNTLSHELPSNYSLSSQTTCKFSQGKSYVLLSLFISGVKNHSLNTPEMTEINPAALYRPALPNPLPEINICLTRKEHSLVEPSVTLERAQSHFWSLRTQPQFTSLRGSSNTHL